MVYNIKRKVNTLFTEPRILWKKLVGMPFFKYLPDKIALKIIYKNVFLKDLNLDNPQTLNEKLQWLKLYNRNTLYTKLVDKYNVKKYVGDILGDEYVIPTIGVWHTVDEIDFEALPNQFVLKCNHGSGDVVICRDKEKLNIKRAKHILDKALHTNYYDKSREWPYKNVVPMIIAERLMSDSIQSEELTDYKFFCFNGKVDCVMVAIERSTGNPKFYFFDEQWNLKRYNKRGKAAPEDFSLPMPKTMPLMFNVARKLSKNLPFVRVDLYSCNDHIYFGELTFFPSGGMDPEILPETDLYFGNMIELNEIRGNQGDK